MSKNYTIKLTPLVKEDVEEVSEIAAEAFMNDPCYSYIFFSNYPKKTKNEKLSVLKWVFIKNFSLRLLRSPESNLCVRVVKKDEETNFSDHNKIVGFLNLLKSDEAEISMWTMLQSGLLLMPIKCGFTSFTNLLAVMNDMEEKDKSLVRSLFEEKEDQLSPNSMRCFYLQRMVILPEYQGLGIGTTALQKALDTIKKEKTTNFVFLHTQKESNVAFYERLGFKKVTEEGYVDPRTNEKVFIDRIMLKECS